VNYQTPTQSGATDANGTFSYLPGETVTFSIGGVQLGAVPGTAKISLFTLAGLTPPASEVALRRELERSQRRATPLVRVMNLARLLIALDTDSNPDNGIDVNGRAADLAGKQIDLGLGLLAFANELDRLAPNITRNIPTPRTLTFAYQASGLTVASHNPVRYEVNSGLLAQRSTTISYQANGARATEVSASAGIGFSTSTSTYSYDALGRTTGISSESRLSSGESSSAFSYTIAFDSRGNRVSTASEQQLFGSPYYRSSTSSTADAYGHAPESTSTVDSDGDGTDNVRQVTRTTFDARGNPVASSGTIDLDNDGVADQRYSFTDTFDANDRLQTEIYDSDDDADGVIDLHAVTNVANDGPRAVVRTVTQDEDVDGVIDDRSTTRYVYDVAGRNTSVTIVDTRGPDDTVYGFAVFTMTYDSDNRLLSQTRTQAVEVGGIPYSTSTSTSVYDARGNLVHLVAETSDAFGGAPRRVLVDHEYGEHGERTMSRVGNDFEADGTVDFESTTQFTNQEFSDGVLALAQRYFDLAGAISLDYVGSVGAGDGGG